MTILVFLLTLTVGTPFLLAALESAHRRGLEEGLRIRQREEERESDCSGD